MLIILHISSSFGSNKPFNCIVLSLNKSGLSERSYYVENNAFCAKMLMLQMTADEHVPSELLVVLCCFIYLLLI